MQLIGERVKALRKRKGISQEKLGAMIGFSQSKNSKIENGNCDSLSDIRLLASALDVKMEDLVREEDLDEKKDDELAVDDHKG